MQDHVQRGSGFLLPSPYVRGEEPWKDNEALREVYDINTPIILQRHREGNVHSTYNKPLTNDFSSHELMETMEEIYQRQQHAFRLNLEFGLVLVNVETGEYRYFRPFSNQSLFERPIYVSKRRDLLKLKQRLERWNVGDYILKQRPNTKWKPVVVTNVHFSLYHLGYLLGAPIQLPAYIKLSKSILSLDRKQNGELYEDRLCVFRCLAFHLHGKERLDQRAFTLFQVWVEFAQKQVFLYNDISIEPKEFEGIPLDQMAYFEECFEVNVNIFHLTEDSSAQSIYKSRCKYNTTIYLNLYEDHLSYITNFSSYATKYQCQTCNRHFNRVDNMQRHQKTCTGRTIHEFPGGMYTSPKTIFDKLEEYDVFVPVKDRLFPWFLVYDFEALLVPVRGEEGKKLNWTAEHHPISVSICSNVDEYLSPHCIVDPDMDSLVRSMVGYMEKIAKRGENLAREKFADAMKELEDMIKDPPLKLCRPSPENNESLVVLDESWEENLLEGHHEERRSSNSAMDELIHKLNRLKEELEFYCKQMICLGFNSSKYDMNLIKSHLAKHLQMDKNNVFTVKRNNQYACLSTSTLKFLDITSYVSPGFTYAKFLKAYDVSDNKGFFPYEWFDDTSKLEHSSLPPHQAFHSSLKNTNISDEEYEFCQSVWRENDMSTFRDFLVWYNNLDVGPFVTAVENLQRYYFERNIDIFKVSISVPGLARHMLFESGRRAGACFSLFDENNKDAYYTIKKNIIGGPSIIFNRYHEVGKTFIRNNFSKPCRKIVGFDANALYLYCIGQPMPTGPFVRRSLENEFKPQKTEKYLLAYDWLDWVSQSLGRVIHHKLNSGKEKKIGPYPVDGYDSHTKTIYQFHGCYWHGHRCWLTRSQNGKESWEKNALKRAKKTAETTDYLRGLGYAVVEMRECTFRNRMRFNLDLKNFLKSRRPPTPQREVTETEILEAVRSGQLFGMVEVDIRVPEQWPSHFCHPSMTPYQYFEEMSPIFCTSEVPYDVIGRHMQDHVRTFDLSKTPRRLLVGGMRARKILLATPLLQWYLEHGLEVTKIYQTLEYRKHACFGQFVRDVSNARRLGDADPGKAIIADTRKLEGNSAFGSTIMDQEKFQDTIYVCGDGQAMLEANLPQFKKMTLLSEKEEYYEVEKAKKKLRLNLPIQIGYFILQYAKLHMLRFYYDFIDKFVERCNFEYCEMDTDSAYMALSQPDFLSVIRPELQDTYLKGLTEYCTPGLEIQADGKHHWFPRTCCQDHALHDKRTPGLFKIEYEGEVMIGLCSKTYIVAKRRITVTSNTILTAARLLRKSRKLRSKRMRPKRRLFFEKKFSSKGISKRTVLAPLSTFRLVLKTQKPGFGTNKGFRARNNKVYTYQQHRSGFSYFYCKTRVLDNGRSTVPLDLELCPVKDDVSEEEGLMEVDDPPSSDIGLDDCDRNNIDILMSLMES